MIERDEPAEDWLLPVGEPAAVAELQCERRLLVGEPEVVRPWPDRGHLAGGNTGPDHRHRLVEHCATALVCIHQRRRRAGHREGPVIASPVAVERVNDVEVGGIAWAQHPVRVDVGVWIRALARDGVDALYEL